MLGIGGSLASAVGVIATGSRGAVLAAAALVALLAGIALVRLLRSGSQDDHDRVPLGAKLVVSGRGLVENAATGHFLDVARQQIDANREPVLYTSEFDLLAFEAVDDVVEAFLRGNHEPQRPAPLLQRLGKSLEVEHPVNASGDVLADLINDEQNAAILAAAPFEQA